MASAALRPSLAAPRRWRFPRRPRRFAVPEPPALEPSVAGTQARSPRSEPPGSITPMTDGSGAPSTPPAESHGWLLRDGKVLAALEITRDGAARRKGLLGRDGLDGALLIDRLPLGAHPRHALRRSTSPTSTRDGNRAEDGPHDAPPRRPADAQGPQRSSRPRPAPSAAGASTSVTRSRSGRDPPHRAPRAGGHARSGTWPTCRPAPSAALAEADAIVCEDTRRTGRLLQHAGVTEPAPARRQRAHRGVVRRRGRRACSTAARTWPSSPTPARRASPTRASDSCGRPSPAATRSRWCRARRPPSPRSS